MKNSFVWTLINLLWIMIFWGNKKETFFFVKKKRSGSDWIEQINSSRFSWRREIAQIFGRTIN